MSYAYFTLFLASFIDKAAITNIPDIPAKTIHREASAASPVLGDLAVVSVAAAIWTSADLAAGADWDDGFSVTVSCSVLFSEVPSPSDVIPAALSVLSFGVVPPSSSDGVVSVSVSGGAVTVSSGVVLSVSGGVVTVSSGVVPSVSGGVVTVSSGVVLSVP